MNYASSPQKLASMLGRIDIYLLDQLLKGNIDITHKILDAGCGEGRNIWYLLHLATDIYAVDKEPLVIQELRLATQSLIDRSVERFQVCDIQELPFEDHTFGTVISIAVLHFAMNIDHFEKMIVEMWRVLKPGGILFVRLASDIGLEAQVIPISGKERWFHLPDGTARFLVNYQILQDVTESLNAILYEPIKTVHVQGMRGMTNWYLQKPDTP